MTIYEIHPIAELVPLASEEEQNALKTSIARIGQTDPIVLWQNKIIDGRCRQQACLDLGIAVKTEEMPWNSTYEEAMNRALSATTRRNLSSTQKAMSAAYLSLNKRVKNTIEQLAQEFAVSVTLIKNAKFIIKHEEGMAKTLFSGGNIEIINKDRQVVSSSGVSAVCAHIKRQKEVAQKGHYAAKEVFNDWNPDAQIKTQLGKDKFSNIKESLGDLNPLTAIIFIDLINDSRSYGPKIEGKEVELIPFQMSDLDQLDKQAVKVFYTYLKIGMENRMKRAIFEYCLSLNGKKLPANINIDNVELPAIPIEKIVAVVPPEYLCHVCKGDRRNCIC